MTDEQSELVSAYTDILKEKNLAPSTAMNCMEAMRKIREGLIELTDYDEETVENMHDVADELAEILGYTVDPERLDKDQKEQVDEKIEEVHALMRSFGGEKNE